MALPAVKKRILSLVKMVKKTLFGTIVIGVKTTTIGERVWGSTQYSKDSWDSESASRVRESLDEKL